MMKGQGCIAYWTAPYSKVLKMGGGEEFGFRWLEMSCVYPKFLRWNWP